MNGSLIARLAYQRKGEWIESASLFWFRSGEAKIRLSSLPVWAMANGVWLHSEFMPKPKVDDAPLVSGEVYAKDGNTRLVLGYITSNQSEGDGNKTTYSLILHAVDIKALCKTYSKESKGLWLKVDLT